MTSLESCLTPHQALDAIRRELPDWEPYTEQEERMLFRIAEILGRVRE